MADNDADFTLTFRRLCDAAAGTLCAMWAVKSAFIPRDHVLEAALCAAATRRERFHCAMPGGCHWRSGRNGRAS